MPPETFTEVERDRVPQWLAEMDFCHIAVDDEGLYSFCGGSDEGQPCTCPSEYDGEAICRDCGKPTCPRCAVLESLESAAEAEEGDPQP